MALLGTGIVPTGAVGNELAAVTRRAFIPKLIVQLYKASPTLSAALSNAQTASGGVSSITVPVQGASLVTAQATDYSGAFNAPSSQTGIQDAEFNLKAVVVPIPFLGMEGIVQLNAAVISLIEARMNDAGNQVREYLSQQLCRNNTAGSINIDGFPLMMDSTTNTYGNIDRSTAANSFWRPNLLTSVAAAPSRAQVLTDIVSAMAFNGGEMPNMALTDAGTWNALAQDFVGQEQYMITPGSSFDQSTQGARAAFTALMVAGVPIYIDPYAGDGEATNPAGTIRYLNTRYFSAYVHEAAAFAFTGFASTLPNMQLGYIGALVAVLEFVCVKSKSLTARPGYTPSVLT
jgi:hypothetical protein